MLEAIIHLFFITVSHYLVNVPDDFFNEQLYNQIDLNLPEWVLE